MTVTLERLDRRKKYTKMVLKESLMHILREKHIAKITVKEVCEEADINRSTFYAHYTDLYDLLEQIEEELVKEMVNYLSSYNFDKKEDTLAITEKLIEYLATKQAECKVLLSENSNSSFEKKVRFVAHKFITNSWSDFPLTDKATFEYVSEFIISGSVQIVKIWLQNDMDKSPEEIARLITNLVDQGIWGAGIDL